MDSSKERGVDAHSQEFSRYEQVKKDQDYNLAEKKNEDEFDDDYVIKTCDMGEFFSGGEAGRDRFAQSLGEALEGIGFAVVEGHGIDPALHEEGVAKTCEFFETTTLEERMKFEARRHGSVNQGYFPIKETTIIHPDLVEGWVFCRRAFNMEGAAEFEEDAFWPRRGDEPFFRQICLEHEKLILPVMQSILRYLGCDPHLYDQKLTGTNFGFRLNYYPPISIEDAASGAGRMLGHEDVDLWTFLPAQSVDGLQVLNRENMKWIRLSPPQGTMIINTGDYMQRITNDRLPSTTHRVSKPMDDGMYGKPRVTLPMAIYVWEEEILDVLPGLGPPKYEPISAIKFHTSITSKYYGDDYAEDVD